jgi:hypothetical protein
VVVRPAGDVLIDVAEVGFGESSTSSKQRAVEEGFGDAEGAAVLSGNEAHGGVGVSGEPGLEERRVEPGHEGREACIHMLTVTAADMLGGDPAHVQIVSTRRRLEGWRNRGRWWSGVVAVA